MATPSSFARFHGAEHGSPPVKLRFPEKRKSFSERSLSLSRAPAHTHSAMSSSLRYSSRKFVCLRVDPKKISPGIDLLQKGNLSRVGGTSAGGGRRAKTFGGG